jgi:hypothetical protein
VTDVVLWPSKASFKYELLREHLQIYFPAKRGLLFREQLILTASASGCANPWLLSVTHNSRIMGLWEKQVVAQLVMKLLAF